MSVQRDEIRFCETLEQSARAQRIEDQLQLGVRPEQEQARDAVAERRETEVVGVLHAARIRDVELGVELLKRRAGDFAEAYLQQDLACSARGEIDLYFRARVCRELRCAS